MSDDDDEEIYGGLYENGYWEWNENEMGLVYVCDQPQEEEDIQILITKVTTGTIQFKDDLDLIEQDVKDIALYTAPVSILTPSLINMLHLPITERFIRTLIFFCQYYLQVEEEMSLRMLETEKKIRTPGCEIIEREFRENLADLRVLIAKEYSMMIVGGGDMKQFHHMGPTKKRRSLSDKDARLFETFLRMCVQIVWLALGRKCFNQIELEVNRIFKTEIFNAVEHRLKTNYLANMTEEQRSVLVGYCVRHDRKMNSCSPLLNEVFCERPLDYRMLGLGVIKYPDISERIRYMLLVTSGPEDIICSSGVVLGIIGLSRAGFDTMLRPVALPSETKSKVSMSMASGVNTKSNITNFSKSNSTVKKLYPDIVLPKKAKNESLSYPSFPEESEVQRACSQTQRLRWQKRLGRLLHTQPSRHHI